MHLILRGACTAVLALCLATQAPAQTSVTPQQLGLVAQQLVDDGNISEAAPMVEALLARDPNDVRALILAARIATRTGNQPAAFDFARKAFRTTDIPEAKFAAAQQAAVALAAQRKDTQAQVWLRRARQFAPNDALRQQVARDYRVLSRRNPLTVNLGFGVRPSSNINNGSVSDTLDGSAVGLPVFQLSRDAQALSGMEIYGSVDLSYRIQENRRSITHLTAGLNGRTYRLSGEARADLQAEVDEQLETCETLAPILENEPPALTEERRQACLDSVDRSIASGSDFSDLTLALGVTHRRILSEGWEPTTFRLGASQLWYAGEPYTRAVQGSVSQGWRLGDRDFLRLTYGIEERRGIQDDNDDGEADVRPVTRHTLTGSWSRQLANGDLMRLTLSGNDSRSSSVSRDYKSLRTTVSYDFGRAIAGVQLGGALSYEERTYSGAVLVPGKRRDQTWTARVGMTFTQIEFYGFNPAMQIEASRSESNSDRFDQEKLSIGFDLRSSF